MSPAEALRELAGRLRRTPLPISVVIPALQGAADEIDRLTAAGERIAQECALSEEESGMVEDDLVSYRDALEAIEALGAAEEPEFRTTWVPEVSEAYAAGRDKQAWVTADIARRALKGGT